MAKQQIKKKICEVALKLASRHDWDSLTLEQLAKASKISLSQVKAFFVHTSDILPALVEFIDDKVADTIKINPRSSPHDRLFETLMARFDILQSYKSAVRAILTSIKNNPQLARLLLQAQWQSMPKMLNCANINPKGVPFSAASLGLLMVYELTLCRWLKDETADMSKTMAALDRYLRYAGVFSEVLFHNHN